MAKICQYVRTVPYAATSDGLSECESFSFCRMLSLRTVLGGFRSLTPAMR
jgi:hypothetical protein